MTQEQPPLVHEIEGAYYNSDGGSYRQTLECSCGFVAQGRTWEQAGLIMDEHLDGVEP